jgi:3-hydroxyisobutyrate dehydrogenase-like beta-hydroxyacid dehydrogenase
MTNDGTKVAVIGLGAMGGRAAARLVAAGYPTAGFDPAESAAHAAENAGVQAAQDVAGALAGADVAILSLPLPAHVAGFAAEHAAAMAAGTTVVDVSTIDPVTAREAAETLGRHGVGYLDAPVLGRPEKCGAWTLAAGGPAETVERVRPMLEGVIARAVVHAGDVGAGSTVKLLNNLTVCRAAGVDPDRFVEILAESNSAAMSNLFRELAPKLLADDFTPTFALRLLHKDNRLAVAMGEQLGCPTFLGSAVHQVNGLGLASGYGAQDTGAVIKVYQRLCATQQATEASGVPAPTASTER